MFKVKQMRFLLIKIIIIWIVNVKIAPKAPKEFARQSSTGGLVSYLMERNIPSSLRLCLTHAYSQITRGVAVMDRSFPCLDLSAWFGPRLRPGLERHHVLTTNHPLYF